MSAQARRLTRAECEALRTPYYCEETTHRILSHAHASGHAGHTLHAIFISTPTRRVPLRHQRASPSVVWDYHVVPLIGTHVHDTDSTLPFPTPLRAYVAASVPPHAPPQFRAVPYGALLESFASDRRHMRDGPPPPSTPCIRGAAAESAFTLPRFLRMDRVVDGDPFAVDAEGDAPGVLLKNPGALVAYFDAFFTESP